MAMAMAMAMVLGKGIGATEGDSQRARDELILWESPLLRNNPLQ